MNCWELARTPLPNKLRKHIEKKLSRSIQIKVEMKKNSKQSQKLTKLYQTLRLVLLMTNLVKKEANRVAWELQETCLVVCSAIRVKALRKLNLSFIQSNVLLKTSTMAKVAESKLAEIEFAPAALAKVVTKVTTKNVKHVLAREKL